MEAHLDGLFEEAATGRAEDRTPPQVFPTATLPTADDEELAEANASKQDCISRGAPRTAPSRAATGRAPPTRAPAPPTPTPPR